MPKHYNKQKYEEFKRQYMCAPDWFTYEFWGYALPPAHDPHHPLGRGWKYEVDGVTIEAEDFLIPVSRQTHNLMKQHPEMNIVCLRIICKKFPEKKKLLHKLDGIKTRFDMSFRSLVK
jgi:hypothetical protein